LAEGPEPTFVRLLEEHGPAVRAMLRHLCRRPHDVDDVWQDMAVRVWRSLQARPRLTNPRGWLATIAYRAYVEDAARRPTTAGPADFERADDSTPSPQEAAIRAEQRHRVQEALDVLPPDLRSVVALHYAAGLSLRDTAEAVGVAVGTVKSRLHAALVLLRRALG
jgi:RNA polymerase sigma-70 factor (ECF subfamily)